MRKIKEVLRLHFEAGLSERQISKICVLGKGTVRRFLKRAGAAGLSWPLPPGLDDAALEKQLFPPPLPPSAGQRPQPDYAAIHKELKGPNVTLQLLWEEYKRSMRTGTATAVSANSTANGRSAWIWFSVRTIVAEKRCSSITPARPFP